ncbi:hypothetical protein MAXJ12_27888 [Mesorhizobium alhagi CCNWXJ12-2]|uniref:Uncharacterized protein n=1 Tax=Mesorhizobium alhagi CCNWXJ12-2 TaxID=1107882 RepID=H0HZE1_9HYPH|nr:hypothetical protein MAXJ12_27888 [Mesorhizobium alhagi CCNWXJ12-2]
MRQRLTIQEQFRRSNANLTLIVAAQLGSGRTLILGGALGETLQFTGSHRALRLWRAAWEKDHA